MHLILLFCWNNCGIRKKHLRSRGRLFAGGGGGEGIKIDCLTIPTRRFPFSISGSEGRFEQTIEQTSLRRWDGAFI